MTKTRPLLLTGFMGAGKSTVGPLLAAETGRTFFDNDQQVFDMTGRTPAEIINTNGEPAFREIEVDVLSGLIERPDVVVATGDGIVATELGRGFLRAVRADVVWLRILFEEAARRISLDTATVRPLFDESARERFNMHQAWYKQTASLIVDVQDKSSTTIATEISRLYTQS